MGFVSVYYFGQCVDDKYGQKKGLIIIILRRKVSESPNFYRTTPFWLFF